MVLMVSMHHLAHVLTNFRLLASRLLQQFRQQWLQQFQQ